MIIGPYPSSEELIAVEKMLADMRIQHWLHHDLFSPQWWLLLFFIIVPWLVWWVLVDRKRLLEILLYGLTVAILASYLDAILTESTFWHYEVTLLPVWPRFITANFTVLPVTYMFLYQYFESWKTFFIASVIMAALYAFVAEPALQWAGIYTPLGWKYIYSFTLYIIIALTLRWLTELIVSKQSDSGK